MDTGKETGQGDWPPSAVDYIRFIGFELNETLGASRFRVHHPAPDDMTVPQLHAMAAAYREQGWFADVAPTTDDEDNPMLGVRISSEDLSEDAGVEIGAEAQD